MASAVSLGSTVWLGRRVRGRAAAAAFTAWQIAMRESSKNCLVPRRGLATISMAGSAKGAGAPDRGLEGRTALGQNAVSFADGQQNRVQHFVDALNDFAVKIVELVCTAALGEPSLFGGVDQPHDFLDDKRRVVVGLMRIDARAGVGCVPILAISITGALQLPVVVYQS
jgi:hypothetical protein